MIVYKSFLKFVWAEKWSILGMIAIFMVMIALLANAQQWGSTDQSFEGTNLRIAVDDQADDALSTHFISYLDQENIIIDVTGMSAADQEETIYNNMHDALITIPANLSDKLTQNPEASVVKIMTNEQSATSVQAIQIVEKYFRFVEASSAQTNVSSLIRDFLGNSESAETENTINETVLAQVTDALSQETDVNFRNDQAIPIATQGINASINLMGYVLLSISLSVVGMIMAAINSSEVNKRIQIGALSMVSFNLQILLGLFVFAILLVAVIVVLLYFLLNTDSVQVDWLRYIISLFILCLMSFSLSYFITRITTNRHVLSILTLVISLGLAFISGVFVPLEVMTDGMQRLAPLSPIYYFVQSISVPIDSYVDLFPYWGTMLGFTTVFILMALVVSKQNRKVKRNG